jgi:hypothetical protein
MAPDAPFASAAAGTGELRCPVPDNVRPRPPRCLTLLVLVAATRQRCAVVVLELCAAG